MRAPRHGRERRSSSATHSRNSCGTKSSYEPTWTSYAHSTEVPVCPLQIPVAPGATSRWAPSPLAGEDIIAPILCTSTTMMPFSFAPRFWSASCSRRAALWDEWQPKRGATDYLGITLHKAAARQASKGVYWLPKVRNTTPNSREGRPLSAVTVAVLTMHAAQPELKLVAIAAQLGIDAAHVRQIVRRSLKATLPALPVVERSCDTLPEPLIAKEEQAILEGKPVPEELMSCPRRYRTDYARPKGWVDIPYMPILADGVTYESNYVLPPRRKPPIRSFNIKGPLPDNMRRVA